MKINTKSTHLQVKEALLELINQISRPMTKLPSEQELAASLGVSRNTVREALKSLENEGYVLTRHGVGTFVLYDPRSLKHNISRLDSTTQIIQKHGYRPGTIDACCRKIAADPEIAERLGLRPGSPLLFVERVRTADDVPLIFVRDYLPYTEELYRRFAADPSVPLFPFLKDQGKEAAFSSCAIHAVMSDAEIESKLRLDAPAALLLLKQVHYTQLGLPLFYSDSYFLTDKLEFHIIRKYIE